MKFVPYDDLGRTPNIIVDGEAREGTLLTLSHWPKSGTPWPLKGNLSAHIVFNYLEHPEFQVAAEAASNNHYDEDGVVSLWALLNPEKALKQKALLLDIASAGDFACFHSPDALRIATAIQQHSDYETALPLMEDWLKAPPPAVRELENYENGRQAMASGLVTLRQVEALDLAVFEFAHGIDMEGFSPYALHNASPCGAVLTRQGARYRFYYRYETWVQYVSRPIRARRDLGALAAKLGSLDSSGWKFGGVDSGAPALERREGGDSKVPYAEFLDLLEEAMRSLPPAWDPLDPRT